MVDSPYAGEMVVRRPPLAPHEQPPLSEMDRDIIGRSSVRLEIALEDRYQVRRELEIIAGAIQRALAATHQDGLGERLVLLSIRDILGTARLRTSRRYQGPRKTALSPPAEADETNPQLPQPFQPRLVTRNR